MIDLPSYGSSRRDFISTSGKLVAGSALAGITLPYVHGQETPSQSDAIQIAVVGCGGRGTGAVQNALEVTGGPIKLVAMADVSEKKLNGSYNSLKNKYAESIDVPEDRRFI